LLGVTVSIFPYFWLFASSLKDVAEMFRVPPTFLPEQPTLRNYVDLMGWAMGLGYAGVEKEMVRIFINSIAVSLLATVVTILISSLAAYSFARFEFPGRQYLLSSIFIIYLAPGIATVFPIFLMMYMAKLLDTWLALIIVYVSAQLPFAIWVIVGYFQEIPVEIEESALVDGCSRLGVLLRIVMPLAAPGLIACALLTFIGCWNEFMYALVLTFTPASKTLPIVAAETQTTEFFEWGLTLAIGSIIAVPAIVLSLIAQRWMARGLTLGAVKG